MQSCTLDISEMFNMLKNPESRSQVMLFSSIDDMIPESSSIRFIDSLVKLILSKKENINYKGKSHTGRPAYSVEVLLKIFVYGFLNRINSSRRLEQETHRNIELIWLTSNQRPDHKTISDFRKHNIDLIKEFNKGLKYFLKSQDLITGELITIDGTKMKAYATKDMLTREENNEKLKYYEEKLAKYFLLLDATDTQDEETEQLRQENLELKQKIADTEAQIAELNKHKETLSSIKRNSISLTDPDCRLMKSRDGFIPGYNVQIASDSKHHFIVNEAVTNDETDMGLLELSLDQIDEDLDLEVKAISADAGYYDADQIQRIEANTNTQCYVSVQGIGMNRNGISFKYYSQENKYVCSEGQDLLPYGKMKQKKRSFAQDYRGRNCKNCKLLSICTKSKTARTVSRYWNQEFREDYKKRMKQESALKILNGRKGKIEHINGTIKILGGKIPLLLRGLNNVIGEVNLYSIAYNIKRLLNVCTQDELKGMFAKYAS